VPNRQATAPHQELEWITEWRNANDFDAGSWDEPKLHQAASKRTVARDMRDSHHLSDPGLCEVHRYVIGTVAD